MKTTFYRLSLGSDEPYLRSSFHVLLIGNVWHALSADYVVKDTPEVTEVNGLCWFDSETYFLVPDTFQDFR